MKKIFIYFSLVFLLFSCENENLSNLPDSGLDINLDLNESNFKMTSTFDLNKISIEDIIELTVNELYSQNQSADLYQKNQDSTDEFIDGFDININDDIVIITPIYDDIEGLFKWFSEEEIIKLQKLGFHVFECCK